MFFVACSGGTDVYLGDTPKNRDGERKVEVQPSPTPDANDENETPIEGPTDPEQLGGSVVTVPDHTVPSQPDEPNETTYPEWETVPGDSNDSPEPTPEPERESRRRRNPQPEHDPQPEPIPQPAPRVNRAEAAFFCDGMGFGYVFNDRSGPEFYAPSIKIFEESLSEEQGQLKNFEKPIGLHATSETAQYLVEARRKPNQFDSKATGIYLVTADLVQRKGTAKRIAEKVTANPAADAAAIANGFRLVTYGGSTSLKKLIVPKGDRYKVIDMSSLREIADIGLSPQLYFNPRIDGKELVFDQFSQNTFKAMRFKIGSSQAGFSVIASQVPSGVMHLRMTRVTDGRWAWMSANSSGQRTFHFWDEKANKVTTIDAANGPLQPTSFLVTMYKSKPAVLLGFEKVSGASNPYAINARLDQGEIRIFDMNGTQVGSMEYPEEVKQKLEKSQTPPDLPLLKNLWHSNGKLFAALPTRFGRAVFQRTTQGEWERITSSDCANGISMVKVAR